MVPARFRGTLRDAGAAGPDLVLAVICLLALFLPQVEEQFGSRIRLILGLEFAALHAFALLWHVWDQEAPFGVSSLRIPAFLALCAVYSMFVYSWGSGALVTFWIMMFSTYSGVFFHDAQEQRKRTVMYRWIVGCAVYFAVGAAISSIATLSGLQSPHKEFLFGLFFFGGLAAADLLHVYDRLEASLAGTVRRSGRSIGKLPERFD